MIITNRLGWAVGLAMVGCGAPETRDLPPSLTACLSLDTDELTIEVDAGATWSAPIEVRNACAASVSFDLDDSPDGFTFEADDRTIDAQGSATVWIRYTSAEPTSLEGELPLLTSTGGDVVASYWGTVLGPQLQIVDENVGVETGAGCTQARPIRLYNSGNQTLDVFDIAFESSGIQLVDAPSAVEIAPGGDAILNLRMGSAEPGSVSAMLSASTNAFAQPVVTHAVSVVSSYQNPQAWEDSLPAAKHDILLVMDRSSCSYDHLVTVPTQVRALQSELDGWDFRAMAAVADDGCIVGDTKFIDDSTGFAEAQDIFATMVDKDFVQAPYGANTERGFTVGQAALSAGKGCNKDVFREDAFLHIIYQSDEPEQSGGRWEDHVEWFDTFKGGQVVHHGVGGPAPSGCASAAPMTGVWDAVQATGGVFRNICDYDPHTFMPTWDEHFEAFGRFVKENSDRSISLDPPALPGSVSVRMEGDALVEGWRLNADGSVLTVDGGLVITGAQLAVTYEAAPPECL